MNADSISETIELVEKVPAVVVSVHVVEFGAARHANIPLQNMNSWRNVRTNYFDMMVWINVRTTENQKKIKVTA